MAEYKAITEAERCRQELLHAQLQDTSNFSSAVKTITSLSLIQHFLNDNWMHKCLSIGLQSDINRWKTRENDNKLSNSNLNTPHSKVITVAFKVKSRDPLKNRIKQNQEELTPPPQHNGPDRSSAILINQQSQNWRSGTPTPQQCLLLKWDQAGTCLPTTLGQRSGNPIQQHHRLCDVSPLALVLVLHLHLRERMILRPWHHPVIKKGRSTSAHHHWELNKVDIHVIQQPPTMDCLL